MNNYETINLNDYVQTGEGGTALTYTHKVQGRLPEDALQQLPKVIG